MSEANETNETAAEAIPFGTRKAPREVIGRIGPPGGFVNASRSATPAQEGFGTSDAPREVLPERGDGQRRYDRVATTAPTQVLGRVAVVTNSRPQNSVVRTRSVGTPETQPAVQPNVRETVETVSDESDLVTVLPNKSEVILILQGGIANALRNFLERHARFPASFAGIVTRAVGEAATREPGLAVTFGSGSLGVVVERSDLPHVMRMLRRVQPAADARSRLLAAFHRAIQDSRADGRPEETTLPTQQAAV